MVPSKNFQQFKDYLLGNLSLDSVTVRRVSDAAKDLPSLLLSVDVAKADVYRLMAQYTGLEYLPALDPEQVNLDALSELFMATNLVVTLKSQNGRDLYLLSDPFNWVLLETLKKSSAARGMDVALTEPEKIAALLPAGAAGKAPQTVDPQGPVKIQKPLLAERLADIPASHVGKANAVQIADAVLYDAVREKASDIHIEPKSDHTMIRFRVDGDLKDVLTVDPETGVMVLARLKALGRLDIAQKYKPQDGALEIEIDGRSFKLRLATSSTPAGESMIMRLLEPDAEQPDPVRLGMTEQQVHDLVELMKRQQGLLLVVGPVGSGKTTTLYSALSRIDLKRRSLLSVEDPVEYKIPFANQQQVNEKAGVTFDALLKSAVRQDPNILFIGEIRDAFSAKVASDFASIGHLTVSTMHAATATSAIFRLERLGVQRAQMADALSAVVAQRLLKKLCPACRATGEISPEEYEMLAPFTDDVPRQVARPVGCPRCGQTGYSGREGVFEVFRFNAVLLEMVRENRSIAEIRTFAAERGAFLLSNHAIEKVRDFVFSPRDVYEAILVEEPPRPRHEASDRSHKAQEWFASPGLEAAAEPPSASPARKSGAGNRVLVVEDDRMTQIFVESVLFVAGYQPTIAADGIDAMVLLSKEQFDLILSDIEMPNLDGFRFLEIKNQKGIDTPVVFLTGLQGPTEEVKAFDLGAVDFLRKPFDREVLLSRIKRILATR